MYFLSGYGQNQGWQWYIDHHMHNGSIFLKVKKNADLQSELAKARLESFKVANEILLKRGKEPIDQNLVNSPGTQLSHIECNDADFYTTYWGGPDPMMSGSRQLYGFPPGTMYSPLIYLHPLHAQNISVKIYSPVLSKTISSENGSWKVFANPDGRLKTSDGREYKFIPYEFLRSDFKRPEKGVVIEGNKLEEYLKSDLWKRLGLTDSEIEDYWNDTKNRVKPANYYFVSFIDRPEIDRVLPMEVNPKPDTIIRNMTYILPLSSKPLQSIAPLDNNKLMAPKRNGFTVLENGVFIDGF